MPTMTSNIPNRSSTKLGKTLAEIKKIKKRQLDLQQQEHELFDQLIDQLDSIVTNAITPIDDTEDT